MCLRIIGIQIHMLAEEKLQTGHVIADMGIHIIHSMLKTQQYVARQVQYVCIIGHVRIAVHG